MSLELWLLSVCFGIAALALLLATAACVSWVETETVLADAYRDARGDRADDCGCTASGWPRRATAASVKKGRHMRRCGLYEWQPKGETA